MDIYEIISERIAKELENGIIPWQKPWVGSTNAAVSHTTGKAYSLLNQILLGGCGEYATFKQVSAEGGKVKKGAKSKFVVFWSWIDSKDKDGNVLLDKNGNPKKHAFLRYYNVFNILTDVEGIEPKYSKLANAVNPAVANERAEATLAEYAARSGVRIENAGQDRAYYMPAMDSIMLPLREQFSETAKYYSTAFHEAVHSTGHPNRLNRFDLCASSHEEYSAEELVAEIGAACLVNRHGLETESSFKNSAAYVQGWLKALNNDKKMIVTAAGKAEKAVQLIMNELDVAAAEKEVA